MTPAAQNPKVISTLVLVFLAGAAAGAVGMRLGMDARLHRVMAAAQSPQRVVNTVDRTKSNRDALLQRMRTELDLTPEQTEAMASVLSDWRHYYQNLQDQLEDVRSTGKDRILQILGPQQRKKFERISGELQPQLEAK